MSETGAFMPPSPPSGARIRRPSSSRNPSAIDVSVTDLSLTGPDGLDPREGLTRSQRRVVVRLARGESAEAAALREDVHPDRLERWSRIPRFQRALRRERATLRERLDPTPGMRFRAAIRSAEEEKT
jgi:hypothetical protein